MKKLVLLVLAASAASIPAVAIAQMQHGSRGGGNVSVRHPGANVTVRHQGGGNVVVRHHGGGLGHPGRHFRHGRLHRGFVVHPFWFGPQFHIQNWQMYGFAPPPVGHRWVRYYDDAYLIDRAGRVHDERYGLDWDRYGERWEMDEGIPAYHGRGDYHPDDEDYAWVADRGSGHAEGSNYSDYGHGSGHGAPPACGPTPHPCSGGHGYGGAYGYHGGYGVVYPIIIETTVHSSGTSYVEEIIEEEVVVPQRARRYRPPPRRAPQRRAPPRRPPPGERG